MSMTPKEQFKMAFGYARAMRYEEGRRDIHCASSKIVKAVGYSMYGPHDPLAILLPGKYLRMQENKRQYGYHDWPWRRGPIQVNCRCAAVSLPAELAGVGE